MHLNIGMVCYPTFGGSGVVATELGKHLATLGHEVHFITYDVPSRLQGFHENIFFHNVDVPPYPLFTYPPYSVALASKMAEVARRAHLNIMHVHYAVPHATSAFLAKTMISPWCIKIVTTLHGTDITLVGSDPSYLPMTRFSIEQSDAVTAVSRWLRWQTIKHFHTKRTIEVIPNFVDPDRFKPGAKPGLRERLSPDGRPIMMHVSNLRPVKRARDLLDILAFVRARTEARLIIVGDGPERPILEESARKRHMDDDIIFLGNYADIEELLPAADVLLLPSASESFGLVALEAMSCGVPVIASDVGGLPEVVEHGKNGYLFEVGDTGAMAEGAAEIMTDPEVHKRMSAAARSTAVERFPTDRITERYIDIYKRLLFIA
ncbi:MAG TPA: N-acetyl-alpha-D-glucosaminyl L-malate synthase BshA [Acidobacteriota bacterium]|nr:N-acetyl-alpha-D-glucosaminyl L-malate synthase BshA [Acidobacteriota bacterium]